MADQETWDLSREEIERRLQKLKTNPKKNEPTRGLKGLLERYFK